MRPLGTSACSLIRAWRCFDLRLRRAGRAVARRQPLATPKDELRARGAALRVERARDALDDAQDAALRPIGRRAATSSIARCRDRGASNSARADARGAGAVRGRRREGVAARRRRARRRRCAGSPSGSRSALRGRTSFTRAAQAAAVMAAGAPAGRALRSMKRSRSDSAPPPPRRPSAGAAKARGRRIARRRAKPARDGRAPASPARAPRRRERRVRRAASVRSARSAGARRSPRSSSLERAAAEPPLSVRSARGRARRRRVGGVGVDARAGVRSRIAPARRRMRRRRPTAAAPPRARASRRRRTARPRASEAREHEPRSSRRRREQPVLVEEHTRERSSTPRETQQYATSVSALEALIGSALGDAKTMRAAPSDARLRRPPPSWRSGAAAARPAGASTRVATRTRRARWLPVLGDRARRCPPPRKTRRRRRRVPGSRRRRTRSRFSPRRLRR